MRTITAGTLAPKRGRRSVSAVRRNLRGAQPPEALPGPPTRRADVRPDPGHSRRGVGRRHVSLIRRKPTLDYRVERFSEVLEVVFAGDVAPTSRTHRRPSL